MRNKLAVIAGEEQCQQEQEYYQDPLSLFVYALKAPETKRQWPRRLKVFFDFLKLEDPIEEQAKQFLIRTKQDFQWAQNNLFRFMTFQHERVKQGKISEATIPNYYKAIKLFCEMNDIVFNWKKITRGMPRVRQAANDRAPTLEELRRLIEYPDRRIKAIVYTMVSSGIRIGAWDYLHWKNVKPIANDKAEIIAAKLTVYAGDREEYYSFITPEAYTSLTEWMEFRASYGEKITGESWLMRDIWQTTNIDYGAKLGLATCPKKLKSSGIKRLLERALWEQGIRQPLKEGAKRHEWKAAHGFRKFYKSRGEQVMKPINVEKTMGHNIGVSQSYYKPTEREVMEDFLKAVPLLTIEAHNVILQQQVEQLTEKSRDNESTIRAKLQEKDNQIETLMKKQEQFQQIIQSLIDSGQLKPST